MTHLELLVEEPSAEAILRLILPRLLAASHTFEIHSFRGKPDLLDKLDARLRAYASWLSGVDGRVVVLVDLDRDDCAELKGRLEDVAVRAGLSTSSTVGHDQTPQVMNRIAIEELEAWFFGDVEALATAYPGVPRSLAGGAKYRDPDAIPKTWEALERVLQRAGHHRGGLAKIKLANDVGLHMDLGANRSRSFNVFRDCLVRLATSDAA